MQSKNNKLDREWIGETLKNVDAEGLMSWNLLKHK